MSNVKTTKSAALASSEYHPEIQQAKSHLFSLSADWLHSHQHYKPKILNFPSEC